MQNASFGRGLIAIFLIAVVLPAAAKNSRQVERAADPQTTSRNKRQPADQMWFWPATWQPERAAVIAEQKPPGSHDKQDPDNKPKYDETPEDYTRRSTEASEKQAYYARWQYYVGIGAAIIGALAAVATAYAAWAAKLAADAAAGAAKEAARSNEIARTTANLELRAYVHVCMAKISNSTSEEFGPTITIGIRNFGQTPAYIVVHRFNYCFQMLGEPKFDKMIERRHSDVGPGQVVHSSALVPLEQWRSRKTLIARGSIGFFVFGDISYFDTFDKTKRRITTYRFQTPIDDEGVSDGPLAVCEDGNEAT